MSRTEAIAQAAELLRERDAIWGKVTGSTSRAVAGATELDVHGVTSDEIGRVTQINRELSRLRMRFDLYGVVRA